MHKRTQKPVRREYEGIQHLDRQFGIDFRALARSTCLLVSSIATRKNHRPSAHVYKSERRGNMRVGWIYDQAYSLALAGKYREALARFDEVLRLEPTYVHAWNQKGLCYYFLEDYTKAIENFRRASALRPMYVESLVNVGCAQQRLDLFDDAIQSFDDAKAIQPGLYETLNNKAISLLALGDFTGALTYFDRCILAGGVKPSVYCLRGLSLFALERMSDGMANVEIALRLDPLNKNALLLRRAFYAYITT